MKKTDSYRMLNWLQNYQQSCDPTEQDSLQKQIDRMQKLWASLSGGTKDQKSRTHNSRSG